MEKTGRTRTFIKSMISCVLVVIILLAAAPLSGFVGMEFGLSASALTDGDYSYEVNEDRTATITGYKAGGGNIEVPSTIGGYIVTNIGNRAFDSCSSLTSVTIPNSVTSIGDRAFYDCYSLESVTIPDSVTNIGYNAFCNCDSLESMTIPNSVTSIGEGAFMNCYSLTRITVDSLNMNYSSDEYGVLFNKDKTELIQYPKGNRRQTYNIPNSVEIIGIRAFYSCSSLTGVTIPDSVTCIDFCAFAYCHSLTSITIPNSITSISERAFSDCTGLTSVTIPNSVTTIGYSAFYGCSSLENVVIPDSVTSINDYAFYGCVNLISATIGNSVTGIGNSSFEGCSGLKNVYYTGSMEQWKQIIIGSDNSSLLSANIHYSHTHTYTSKVTKAATCTEDGVMTYTCFCGESYTEIVTHAGHTPVIDAAVAATCITDGKTEGSHCSVCKAVLTAQTTIEATDHTYFSKVTKDATCTQVGVMTFTCSKCGDTYTEAIYALGHNYSTSWKTDKAATCTEAGSKSYHCTHCDAKTDVTTISKIAHKTKTTTTKATTSKAGKIVTACTVCGTTTKTVDIARVSTIKLLATSYTYDGKEKKPTVTVKDSNGKLLKSETDYSVSYASGRKNIGSYTVKVTLKGNYSGTKTLTFKIVPAKVTSLKVKSQTTKSITLSWKKVTGAAGYQVYKYDSTKKAYVKVKATTGTTYKVTGLKAGTTYKFKVRAYKKVNDSNVYGAYSAVLSTATKTAAPKVTVTAGSKKAVLSWNKISGATGYVVYMSTSKDGAYKKVATIKKSATVKYTQTGLTKGKTYYFKARAYKTVDGKNIYSAYSSVKGVKIK